MNAVLMHRNTKFSTMIDTVSWKIWCLSFAHHQLILIFFLPSAV